MITDDYNFSNIIKSDFPTVVMRTLSTEEWNIWYADAWEKFKLEYAKNEQKAKATPTEDTTPTPSTPTQQSSDNDSEDEDNVTLVTATPPPSLVTPSPSSAHTPISNSPPMPPFGRVKRSSNTADTPMAKKGKHS